MLEVRDRGLHLPGDGPGPVRPVVRPRLLVPVIGLLAAGFALGAARPWVAPAATPGRPLAALDWMAGSTLQLGSGETLKLGWRARPWDPDGVARLRTDRGARQRANSLLPVQADMKLQTPVALRVNAIDLEPGIHRLALQMDDAGVLRLHLLKEQRFLDLGAAPFEDTRKRSHLTMSLLPSTRGTVALRYEWGPEWGEAVLFSQP